MHGPHEDCDHENEFLNGASKSDSRATIALKYIKRIYKIEEFTCCLGSSADGVRGAECRELEFDNATGIGQARMKFIFAEHVGAECLEQGELIEMLDGQRVIAVGKVYRPQAICDIF